MATTRLLLGRTRDITMPSHLTVFVRFNHSRIHHLHNVDIGKRKIVGPCGKNGELFYIDNPRAPFPPIRFKEDVGEIAVLREKEKGDWKKLSLSEKKTLYRASFCQTLVEVEAPTGEWKSSAAIAMACITAGVFVYLLFTRMLQSKMSEHEQRKKVRQLEREDA